MALSPLSLARKIKTGKNVILYFHFCSSWECKKISDFFSPVKLEYPRDGRNHSIMELYIIIQLYSTL